MREAKVWNTLDHPSVTRFIGVCYEDEFEGHRIPRQMSEFYERRTLKDNPVHIQSGRQILKLVGICFIRHCAHSMMSGKLRQFFLD
jgi:hypothetical protein